MTISSTNRKAGPFIGNGSASVFAFSFRVFAASDLEVVRITVATGVETTLTFNSDYTVSLNADQNSNPGGSITLTGGALASGYNLILTSDIANLQPTDLTNQGGFYPEVITDALDRATIQIQQLAEENNRSLKLPITTSGAVSRVFPPADANKLLGWNPSATALRNVDASTLGVLVAYGTAQADLFSGNGTKTVFTLSRDPGGLNNLDVSVAGVVLRPGIDYTWSSGKDITFLSAPGAGTNNVLVRYMEGLPTYTADSADVRYLPAGTGATARTVQDKLRETISVTDFGADPTGVNDSTAAIQAAINSFALVGGYNPANVTGVTIIMNGTFLTGPLTFPVNTPYRLEVSGGLKLTAGTTLTIPR